MIGNFFSNGWKNRAGFSNDWKIFFQWLENSSRFFPMIGKIFRAFSNDWKKFSALNLPDHRAGNLGLREQGKRGVNGDEEDTDGRDVEMSKTSFKAFCKGGVPEGKGA